MPFDYSKEPEDGAQFTRQFNTFYARFAKPYDWLIKILPTWRNWLANVLPHIQGPKVLEVSFGTGYLLTRYADRFETYGVDLNQELAGVAANNLQRSGVSAQIQVANVEYLPYPRAVFDSIVNTMAFTAYPDGRRALAEMTRVLKPGGRLVMLDIDYPKDGNWTGILLTKFWQTSGDIIRDMSSLFEAFGYQFIDLPAGGYGSLHLYIATKSGEVGD